MIEIRYFYWSPVAEVIIFRKQYGRNDHRAYLNIPHHAKEHRVVKGDARLL